MLSMAGTHTILHLSLPAEYVEATEETAEESIVAAAPFTDQEQAGYERESTQKGLEADANRPLVCAGLDDSAMSRYLLKALFDNMLNADPERSCALGETREEQRSFVDVALGRKSASLQEITPPLSPVDIVVLDQNIDIDDGVHLLGSDLAGQLHAASFCGLTCIMTGSSHDDIDRMSRMPGVDLVLEKGAPLAETARKLRAAYDKKAHR